VDSAHSGRFASELTRILKIVIIRECETRDGVYIKLCVIDQTRNLYLLYNSSHRHTDYGIELYTSRRALFI
jgi:hypothetical protein